MAVRAFEVVFIETRENFRHWRFLSRALIRKGNHARPESINRRSRTGGCRYAGMRLSVRWRAPPLVGLFLPFFDLALHDAVAFASRFLEFRPVYDLNFSAGMRDESGFVQHSGGYGHT